MGLMCGLVSAPFAARADENKEYLVKAAFLYNFLKFVEWPGPKAIASQSRIDVCVLGDSPMIKQAEVFRAGSTPKLAVSLVAEPNVKNAAVHCHILFIARGAADSLGDILGALKGQPVLTVSDMDDFVERGGMIGFVLSNNKIKVAVNTRSISSVGMRVDAQLLEIALKVIDR